MKVKLTKVSSNVHDGNFAPGYWITGISEKEPETGQRFHLTTVFTTSLGNVERFTWFHTSEVLDIIFPCEGATGLLLETKNSVWRYEIIP